MFEVLSMKRGALTVDNLTFTFYYNQLKLISKSIFKWEGLPSTINEAHIEKFLYSEGSCMFYEHEDYGYIVARCTHEGLNYYDEPVDLRPVGHGIDDIKSHKVEEDCVLIRNNDDMVPTKYSVRMFAYRLAQLKQTQDINIKAMKTPVLILTDHKQMLTMKNIYEQYDGGKPVIFGSKNLDMDSVKVMKTDAPVIFDKLQLQVHSEWNECMTFLGVNNANQDKKERLVDDEVQANNEQVMMNAHAMLKARQRACDEINRLYGLNVSVSLRIKENEQNEVTEDVGGVEG